MANSFLTKLAIGNKAMKPLRAAKVHDGYPAEVAMEGKRLTGVSKSLLRGYQESPARFLPKTKSLKLRQMMGGK